MKPDKLGVEIGFRKAIPVRTNHLSRIQNILYFGKPFQAQPIAIILLERYIHSAQ